MIRETRPTPLIWIIVWFLAVVSRVTTGVLLPNAEQDAYSYVEEIARFSAKLGHLRVGDLFGFWLPLFQFVSAIPNALIGNPLMVGKVLSALSGAVSCVLVFAITEKLTRNIVLSFAAFALVLCNPFHILYSAASMTDLPYGCLVLASLWFVLHKRWLIAAIFTALAEGVRIEAWTLVIVLPLVQLAWEHRISLLVVIILLLPPLAWFGICFVATGDPLAYFAKRVAYHANYMDFYSSRHGFAWPDIRQDVAYFLLGANQVAVVAIVAAGGLSIYHAVRGAERFCRPVAATVFYAAAIFGLLFIGYVTKRQPVILPRYGLIFFLLGLPLLAWLLQVFLDRWKKSTIAKVIAAIVLLLCLGQSLPQLPTISKVVGDFHAHHQIAAALVAALQQSPDHQSRCFSDNPAIRVLSHLPPERFARSNGAPAEAWKDADVFESFLQQERVAYLVFTRVEDSIPAKLFPGLGRRGENGDEKFQLLSVAFSSFGPDIWLYRLRNSN